MMSRLNSTTTSCGGEVCLATLHQLIEGHLAGAFGQADDRVEGIVAHTVGILGVLDDVGGVVEPLEDIALTGQGG